METLTGDIGARIIAHIDDDTVKELYTTSTIQSIIRDVYGNNMFWRDKVQIILGYEPAIKSGVWKRIYFNLKEFDAINSDMFIGCCEKGYESVVELLLLDGRIDSAFANNKAIQQVCSHGHLEVFKLLIDDTRVNPAAFFNRPIINAARVGSSEIVRLLLLDDRVDPNSYDSQAIGAACDKGHTEVVRVMLTDPRVVLKRPGCDLLYWPCIRGFTDIAKMLIGDPRMNDVKVDWGMNLINAAESGHVEVFKLLMEDTRVNPGDRCSLAIRRASENGHVEIVRLLMEDPRVNPGIDYLQGTKKESDALIHASKGGYKEIVRLLLRDKRINPINGYAIQYARDKGYTEILRMLEEYNARHPSTVR